MVTATAPTTWIGWDNPRADALHDPSLHLPRLLCFHGGGTNSNIFRTQCRAISKALATSFRFCFVEAPYRSHPGPDVARVFKDMGPFKAWLRWKNDEPDPDTDADHQHHSQHPQHLPPCPEADADADAVRRIHDSIQAAMDQDNERGGTGEWVGLLGFSQGAKICASILFTQQHCAEVLGTRNQTHGHGPSPDLPRFRFAVLLAGRAPLVWLDATSDVTMATGVVGAATLSTALNNGISLPPIPLADRLRTPTLHVHGLRDPGLSLHQEFLYRCCDPATTQLLEWDGAHQVPIKSVHVRALVQEILVLAGRADGHES
ncbi:hypothetical protein A1O3_02712 [Capronia epimyces CBS 606.96]|uniref:Serine hydrolase domain-containing protein n=1 Tax=Capronia epimyces CBS 606.96 TaxID=1182542 RepID=W9YIY2_9EURO|nr:uncharacterized protein A1O3_02712 [Capronia epimyces CBS 606.96]EXJ89645.1 hypothetical protein A1O3_02712 [Capronia epimyces CBS 606.96]